VSATAHRVLPAQCIDIVLGMVATITAHLHMLSSLLGTNAWHSLHHHHGILPVTASTHAGYETAQILSEHRGCCQMSADRYCSKCPDGCSTVGLAGLRRRDCKGECSGGQMGAPAAVLCGVKAAVHVCTCCCRLLSQFSCICCIMHNAYSCQH
jgi:hypothetical protein